MTIVNRLSKEFDISPTYAVNIIGLIDEGCTVPFIARYRKEMHGEMDDQLLRKFSERLEYLRNLDKRKQEIKTAITESGKWSDEIAAALSACATLAEAEDVYRPFKKKRKTRAAIAVEKGLAELAERIMNSKDGILLDKAAEQYINTDKEVLNAEDAIAGASDIVAEIISDDAALRKKLRNYIREYGAITAKLTDNEKSSDYESYSDYSEPIKKAAGHRILAVNRGEKDECLKVGIKVDSDKIIEIISSKYNNSFYNDYMRAAVKDAYSRLIFPSIEREIRAEMTENAVEGAIGVFKNNLEPLLMQPPVRDKVVMGFDPGYRTGCKVAVVDKSGKLLDHAVIYVAPPHVKTKEALLITIEFIKKYKVDIIAIGNGTASKETEIFVVDLIKKYADNVKYAVVSEAGASIYSASVCGAEEFPNLDVTVRSAVSIARRLQDPMAELIKIDVKSIGVGQYQHDMPQKRLTEVLDGTVEKCVNEVGADVNTASYFLLSHVSGLNASIAKNIVKYRENKAFDSRKELLKVPKLGSKTYEQCVGFLRINGGNNVLDCTGVHPESYNAVKKIMELFSYNDDDVALGNLAGLSHRVSAYGEEKLARECCIGLPTLKDIIEELKKPGRDVRENVPGVTLRDDLLDIKDLKVGMEISGIIRNVVDFGLFVDIGVHQDGLVHISEISNRRINHPGEVAKVGDTVTVRVLESDIAKKRIALTMKGCENKTVEERVAALSVKNTERNKNAVKPQSLEEKLALLVNKFGKKKT